MNNEKKIWTPPTVIVISTVNDVEDLADADAETDIKEKEE